MKIDSNFSTVQQKGFTIVELMIAGTLGLLLIAGVIQLFTSSNKNFTMQEELANLQEDGRFAMIFLENEIQQGGWINDWSISVPPAVNMTNSSDGAINDSVAISYAVPINGVANRDCNGAVVASGVIENRFYVGGANGEELMCQGNGGGAVAQPLIDGVKGFQVLYGVETNNVCPDGVINSYLTHDEFVAAGNSVVLVSVRVAVLLGSEENVRDQSKSVPHQLLDTVITTNDRLAYRLFQQTIYMPNSVFSVIGNPEMSIDCKAGSI